MCMQVFQLRRCLSIPQGGCDKYWAELVGHEGCDHGSHGGIPQEHCKCAWGGFDRSVSSQVRRHDFYIRRAVSCPQCLHRQDLDWLRAEAERERRGEFSANVQTMLQDMREQKDKEILRLTSDAHCRLWDAVQTFIGGLNRHADLVWDRIESVLYGHFGFQDLAKPAIQGLVATLQDAKTSLVGHVRTTTREMATGLVGPRDNTRQLVEAEERFERQDAERRMEAVRRLAEAAEAAFEALQRQPARLKLVEGEASERRGEAVTCLPEYHIE